MDMTSTWCSGEVKAEVVEALTSIGCCDLCILRYLGVKEPYIYRDKVAVAKILGKEKDLEAENENENGEGKRAKVNPCTACLGLLQAGTRHDSLNKVVSEIRESKIESMSFCPVLSVPISILIRAYSIWFYLIKKFPSVYLPIKEYKPESISLKSVWKWISTKYLQTEVNPLSDWSNDGKLTIQIFPSYVDEEKECQPLHDHFTQGGKVRVKKGHVAVSRGSVEGFLRPLECDEFSAKFQCPPEVPTHSVTIDRIVCSHAAIYVAGRYCKYSRVLSQTPWVIDGARKTADSVEELISAQILPLLGADEARFSSSGREDVDVRTLGKGRPFVFEVINPRRTIFTRERMMELQKSINESTPLVSVRDLQIVDKKDLSILKDGEESKTKNYCALCIAPGHPITEDDCERLNKVQLPLVLMQKTPVRVMHRRSLAVRERSIFEMKAIPVSSPKHNQSLFKLHLKTQAGTYVKEFVHGDLGRTSPNVSDLLGFSADIIALDVESVDVDWPPEIKDEPISASTPAT